MTAPPMTAPIRDVPIDFLSLDLETCTRCQATDATLLEAIERTRPALDTLGLAVRVTKTLVSNEGLAHELGFVTSPTIRIAGVDIAGELVESACEACREACACQGAVACRDWIYRGERSTEPPLGLIVEAILRHAVESGLSTAQSARPTRRRLPKNLRRYFGTKAAQPPASVRCSAQGQLDCCEPAQQATCCGDAAAPAPCACRAEHGGA